MLNNLVNDLLDLAKFDQNKFKFDLEFFDLIQLIDDSISSISYFANEKQIHVEKVLDD